MVLWCQARADPGYLARGSHPLEMGKAQLVGETKLCLWCWPVTKDLIPFGRAKLVAGPWESPLGGCSRWDGVVWLLRAQPQTRLPRGV